MGHVSKSSTFVCVRSHGDRPTQSYGKRSLRHAKERALRAPGRGSRLVYWFGAVILVARVATGAGLRSQPRNISITLPDYQTESRDEAFEKVSDAYRALTKLADSTMEIVENPEFSIEQRTEALTIIECLDGHLTARRLVSVIDLIETRGVFFREKARGRYPIVTVLKDRGPSVAPAVVAGIQKETNEKRFAMLCDVLEAAVGTEAAVEMLEKKSALEGVEEWQKARLNHAKDLVESTERGYSEK